MKNARTSWITGVGAVIILGVLFVGSDRLLREGASALKKSGTVELRDDGFYPRTLVIEKGGEVTFVSRRSLPFWPASDLHPSHALYSEFDPKRPIGAGESWTFRFEKVGTWNYHDHIAPSLTGTIVVTEGNARSEAAPCERSRDSQICLQSLLVAALEARGIDAAFDLLADLYNGSPEFAPSCHYYAHNLGIAAYRHYLKDRSSVLTPKASFCANGFYHGFMEGLLTATHDPAQARAFCDYVNEKVVPQAPDAALQCHHGIGHGAMDIAILETAGAPGNIREDDLVAPALRLCETTSHNEKELYRCASGVYNGIANFYITGEHGLKANEADPLELCHRQPDHYKEACYGNLNAILLLPPNDDLAEALILTGKIPDPQYIESAIRYVAGLGALFVVKKDPERAIVACRTLTSALRPSCIEGLAHGLLEHGRPGEEYKEALEFCRNPVLSAEERDACLRYALSGLRGWYPKERVGAICERLSENERSYCRN